MNILNVVIYKSIILLTGYKVTNLYNWKGIQKLPQIYKLQILTKNILTWTLNLQPPYPNATTGGHKIYQLQLKGIPLIKNKTQRDTLPNNKLILTYMLSLFQANLDLLGTLGSSVQLHSTLELELFFESMQHDYTLYSSIVYAINDDRDSALKAYSKL